MEKRDVVKAHVALIFCNIVWACDYPFYNLLLGKYISPLAMVTASLVVAALLSWIPAIWEGVEHIERKDWGLIIVAALMMGMVRKMMMMFGLSRTSPIDGSIISTSTPLLVLVLSVAIGIERFTKLRVVGLLMGMAGTVAIILLSNNPANEHISLHSVALGNILIFTSVCVSAVYMVWYKNLVAKYRVSTILRWIYSLSAVVMLPFGAKEMLAIEFRTMPSEILWAALFVLIVPTYLPNLLLNISLRRVPPTISSVYSYLQPVVAIGLAVAMGLDKLHADTILFAVVVFVGVGMVIASYRYSR
jgi:drug/metabolite transporter (DMT)-like permease